VSEAPEDKDKPFAEWSTVYDWPREEEVDPTNPHNRAKCDRCGVPTRSEFEPLGVSNEWQRQFEGGLHAYVRGYDGGFWDTMSFMGDEPTWVALCHDCSAWLCREIPKLAAEAEGGHLKTNIRDGCDCEWGVIDDDPREDVAMQIPSGY